MTSEGGFCPWAHVSSVTLGLKSRGAMGSWLRSYNLCVSDSPDKNKDKEKDKDQSLVDKLVLAWMANRPKDSDALVKVRAKASHIGINTSQGEFVFTDEIKLEYIRLVSETGVLGKAAYAVGIHPLTAIRHRKNDPMFEEAVQQALEIFRDKIDLAVYTRAIEGWDEPCVFQGELTGSVVRKYSDQLLSLFAKRHNPAYRDHVSIDANVKQAVLVVSAPAGSVEQMQAEAARLANKEPECESP